MSKTAPYQGTPFLKMHGIGNDFVILDARTHGFSLSNKTIQCISNRRTGVGCDQLLLIEPSKEADAFMRIYNADGSEVEQCGNGIRCIASLVMDEKNKNDVRLETRAGVYNCHRVPGGIAIDMGLPIFDWQGIPLSEERDTLNNALKPVEATAILNALKRNGYNRKATALELGMHKSTLFRKIQKLGISLPRVDGRSDSKTPT